MVCCCASLRVVFCCASFVDCSVVALIVSRCQFDPRSLRLGFVQLAQTPLILMPKYNCLFFHRFLHPVQRREYKIHLLEVIWKMIVCFFRIRKMKRCVRRVFLFGKRWFDIDCSKDQKVPLKRKSDFAGPGDLSISEKRCVS